jgi:hypothetical protein
MGSATICEWACASDAPPARLVRLRVVLADGEDFARGEPLVARGEGIDRAALQNGRPEILRAALALGCEDDPGVMERIAAKFGRHGKRELIRN